MKLLHALSIRTRLLAGIILTVSLFSIALWSLLSGMQSVATQFEGFVDRDLARMNGLQQLQAEGSQVVIAAAKKLMVPSLQPPKAVAEEAAKRFDTAFAALKGQYRADALAGSAIAEVDRLWTQVRAQAVQVIDQVEEGETFAARELFTDQVQKDWGQIRKVIQPLINKERARVDAARAAVQSDTDRAIWQGLWLGLAALVGGLLVSLFFSAQVRRLVSDAAERLGAIAVGDGDLSQRLDETGAEDFRRLAHGFNTFTARIQSLVRDVAGSTEEMNAIAGRLTEIASATHGNATRQNDVSTQVATAISEMSTSVRDVAQNAQQAADAAMAAERQVVDGNQIVADTREAIRGLNQQVGHAADTMNSLEKETEKVGSVLTVIREIAEQTNLLALNAAIEAARAGEQGRGFAVVADEVRTLAARTQQSTQEIESMIDSLQTGARSMAGVMEAGREEATRTANEADRAHVVLAAINEAVGQIHEMNAGIAAAAEEQGTAATEIERSAHELSALADKSLQTASSADETATQLAAVGEQAVEVIARFKH